MSSMLRCLLFETVAVDAVDCVDCWDELGAASASTAVFSTSSRDSTRFSSVMVLWVEKENESLNARDATPRDRVSTVSVRPAVCPDMET